LAKIKSIFNLNETSFQFKFDTECSLAPTTLLAVPLD